jgi:hypothetical protein
LGIIYITDPKKSGWLDTKTNDVSTPPAAYRSARMHNITAGKQKKLTMNFCTYISSVTPNNMRNTNALYADTIH